MAWTVTAESTFESAPVKGSRFTATVAPAKTAAEALMVVADLRLRFPRANHHCWAFALADGTTRSSDDGEPSGSAGRPILARIEGRSACDVVVVVTRWFGGTKLGIGGLVRAYGGCAGQGLDTATPVVLEVRTLVTLVYGYADTGAVESVLSELGAEDERTTYGADVERVVRIAPEAVVQLQQRIIEVTAGRASAELPHASSSPGT
ncbi:MAG: hypothetical protein CL927_01910 [Deltaproteobacteria bacterium]|nr:hypothetical protein [Deltaproteobacteria bacterium]